MSTQTKALGERSVNIPTNAQTSDGSKKRKSDSNDNVINPDDVDLGPNFEVEWSANQVRAKIRQFINSGEMKVGEFQDKIGVGSGSYSRFMSQNGPEKGTGSDTFWAAAEFFKRRQLAGLKMPRATKKSKTTSASNTDGSGGSTTDASDKGTSAKKEDRAAIERANDVSDIHLDGEDADSIPVHNTCDDVRIKINRYLRATPGASNASFIRVISAALPASSDVARPTARQLSTFLNKHGPTDGAQSPVFYASYVFFEKMRVKQGKPKSKKRLEMEKTWGRQGMELEDLGNRRIIVKQGSRPYLNQFGELKGV